MKRSRPPALSTRIAVMRAGTLPQVDTPERVYQWPANEFVAGFIGSPAMNIVDARLTRTNGEFHVSFGESTLVLDDELIAARPALLAYEGATVTLGIRPEDFEDAAFASEARAGRTIDTVCRLREALGSEVLVHFPVESASFVARVDPQTAAREGEPLRLVVDTRRLHFFEPGSGLAIHGQAGTVGDRWPASPLSPASASST